MNKIVKFEPNTKNYLPHNFLAEKMILSCMLVNSHVIEIVIKNLTTEAFYFKNHQEIFKTILILHKNKKIIDIITLTTFLQETGKINQIGGIKVLIELINQVPNLVYLDDYVKLVKDKFIRRLLIKLGYKIINSSYITNIPLETILNDLDYEIFTLTNNFQFKNLVSSTDLIYKVFLELQENSINPILPGLASGFYSLDSFTQGFQNSDLIIIAGRPSIGKTAFALSIILNVLNSSKLPVLIFSLEMSKKQIIYRLLSMETNISQLRLRSGKLYKTDWIKLNKILKIFSKIPLFIDDTSNLSIYDIRSKIKLINSRYQKIGLVVVDYLQLMQSVESKNENRVQELAKITRSLKNIANDFNLPVIALSQLSRSIETRSDKKPILSDLRESGSIEQDADLVLMLYKNEKSLIDDFSSNSIKIIDLIVAKQRNGPTGNLKIKFDQIRTKYSDL
uniref:replication helicase subunit n=1 Tax=Thalassionema frauenfeldii TaxID=186022 RepID=UPI001EDDC6A4|nr:replication helicase subunit [Thalassionema frauenfeldii]UHY40603.1 replication helicase subunit [Thalassionema frauenfeldii]UHY40991.1 replication helicase subunit [Thalassionema frauenfeldii]